MEVLYTTDYPWDSFHHRSFFLSDNYFHTPSDTLFYTIKDKDFIPPGHVDWLKNPIPTPDAFEEGNMENISPTIKIDISVKPNTIK
jgi:hypothetical protein